MPILAELRVVPVGTCSTSLSSYIAKVVEVLKRHRVKHYVNPMGTCIEVQSFEELALLLNEVVVMLRSFNVNRIVIDIALDIRFDKEPSLEGKVRSVEEKLGMQ
jgi:uncharacterized protein (TIGR00106 family)